MKKFPVIFVVTVAIGFAGGRLGSGLFGGSENSAGEVFPDEKSRIGSSANPTASGTEFVQITSLVTSENIESLLAQGESVSYAGLALWMLDADASEIADYWARCPKDGLGGDIKRLIFLNWTRLDPGGAIAATSGKEESNMVWWAWAASDPRGALAAAGPEQYQRVAKGIGEFHPAWLMEHFSEIPENAQNAALEGLMTWKENDDPAATLDFLREHGQDFHEFTFKAFALKDPWAAFDWLQKNGKLQVSKYPGQVGPVDILIREMKGAHADDLERMAATLPAGKLKRMMEEAAFEDLVANDPDKALKFAKEAEAPLMSAKRLGIIGAGMLASEPDNAFGIAAEILKKVPDGLSPERYVTVGDSSFSYSGTEEDAAKFFNSLIAKDPARTLDMAVTAADGSPGKTFSELTSTWAETDLKSYATWVNRQSEPAIRTAAISTVMSQLGNMGSYEEAGDWAMTSPDRFSALQSLVWTWASNDKSAAKEWFESADIPAKEKQGLLQQISEQ